MIERTSIETNGNENGIQKSDETNNTINRWFNKPEIDKQEVLSNEEINKLDEKIDKSNYKNYFIVGSIIIVSGIIWYYWNDIRPGDAGNTILEKIRSFRSWFNNDSNNIINNNPGNNQMDIQTNVNSLIEDIQVVDNTNPPTYNQSLQNKGKSVLTSPSLENLTEQAESSWGEGSLSTGSDRTLTQGTLSSASNFIKNNWRNKLPENVNTKINFIESSLIENNLSSENRLKFI